MKRLYGLLCALAALLSGSITAGAFQFTGADDAILAALETYHANPELLYHYREVGHEPESLTDAGVVYLELVALANGQAVPGLIELMVVVPDGNTWQTYLPGQPGYTTAFENLPAIVQAQIDTTLYKPQADLTLVSNEQLRDYGLPFPHGYFGTVTRSYAQHGRGTIDFDLTGRDVTAVKDGVVVYANDSNKINGAWWYWNVVIIQHGEHEYSLYGHLAPDSLPEHITSACDLTRFPGCQVPVKRGEVIGREGNTGNSSNLHLHLELGQRAGLIAYPDLMDGDRDGNRTEPVYTAFVFAEQDVGFVGYSPDEVRQWEWGRVEQAAHSVLPESVNFIRNGSFDSEKSEWTPVGQLNWAVEEGVMRVTRLRSASPPYAAFYQDVSGAVLASDTLNLTLRLGNASGIPKQVSLMLRPVSDRDVQSLRCVFDIPPNTAVQRYSLRGTPEQTWADVRLWIEVSPADGSPAALVDDVDLRRAVGETTELICISS